MYVSFVVMLSNNIFVGSRFLISASEALTSFYILLTVSFSKLNFIGRKNRVDDV